MMKNLFLTSSFKDVVPLFTEFESNLQGKTVTFIPTASTVEEVVFYVEAGKKSARGFRVNCRGTRCGGRKSRRNNDDTQKKMILFMLLEEILSFYYKN